MLMGFAGRKGFTLEKTTGTLFCVVMGHQPSIALTRSSGSFISRTARYQCAAHPRWERQRPLQQVPWNDERSIGQEKTKAADDFCRSEQKIAALSISGG